MRVFMTVVALLEWFALSLQLWLSANLAITNGTPVLTNVINYFSYFTILCNLLVALVVTFTLWGPPTRAGRFFSWPTVQSGVAVYIAIVGIVYSIALRHIWDPQGLQKVADVLLHDLLPVLYVVFWFLFVAHKGLRWKDALWWLIFPAAYYGYSLVRGALVGWYPYPFLDPRLSGSSQVGINIVAMVGGFLVVGSLLIVIADWRQRRAN